MVSRAKAGMEESLTLKQNKAMKNKKQCNGNCGMNYCDDNGCNERDRVLTDHPYPELKTAFERLRMEIFKALRIPQIVEWISNKIGNGK